MNESFLIPHRPGGIAELHFGLMGTYYICQKLKKGLIFDASWSNYNKKKQGIVQPQLGSRGYNINLWKALYKQPDKIDNVHFYSPEEFPELYVNNDFPHDVHNDAIIIADHNKQNTMKEVFLNNDYKFIYNTYRTGVSNVIWPEMQDPNLINYYDFVNNFEYADTFNNLLQYYLKNFFDNKFVIGVHIRQSSEKELGNAGFPPNWFTTEKVIPLIEKHYTEQLSNNPAIFLCTDCPVLNKEVPEYFGDKMFSTKKVDIGAYNVKNSEGKYIPRKINNKELLSKDCSNHIDKDGFAYYDFLYSAIDHILLGYTKSLLYTSCSYFTFYAQMAYKHYNRENNIHQLFKSFDLTKLKEYIYKNKKYTFGKTNKYRWEVEDI